MTASGLRGVSRSRWWVANRLFSHGKHSSFAVRGVWTAAVVDRLVRRTAAEEFRCFVFCSWNTSSSCVSPAGRCEDITRRALSAARRGAIVRAFVRSLGSIWFRLSAQNAPLLEIDPATHGRQINPLERARYITAVTYNFSFLTTAQTNALTGRPTSLYSPCSKAALYYIILYYIILYYIIYYSLVVQRSSYFFSFLFSY